MARKPSWLRRLHQEQALLIDKVFSTVYAEANEKSEPIVDVQGAFNGRHSTGFRKSKLDYNGRLTYLNAPPTNLAATIKARSGLGPNKDEVQLKSIGNKFGLQITAPKSQRWDGNEAELELSEVRVGTFMNGKPKYKPVGKPDSVPKFRTEYKKRPRYK